MPADACQIKDDWMQLAGAESPKFPAKNPLSSCLININRAGCRCCCCCRRLYLISIFFLAFGLFGFYFFVLFRFGLVFLSLKWTTGLCKSSDGGTGSSSSRNWMQASWKITTKKKVNKNERQQWNKIQMGEWSMELQQELVGSSMWIVDGA